MVTSFALRRGLMALPILIGVSLLVFVLARVVPGDPALIATGLERADAEELARVAERLGLNRPLPVQYADYLGDLLRGDLGESLRYRRPVTELIFERLGATLELAGVAFVVATVVGIPLGVVSAVRRGLPDWLAALVAVGGMSVPAFWLGLLLILLFSLHLGWFPASARGGSLVAALGALFAGGGLRPLLRSASHLVLPAVALAAPTAGLLARMTRSGMMDVMGEDYILAARSRGIPERSIVYRHALKNALIPVVTVAGLFLGRLLGGAVILETIFAWPGVGRLAVLAVRRRDYAVVQGTALLVAAGFVLINAGIDLLYARLDPRIRYD